MNHLIAIAPDIWYAKHHFKVGLMHASSHMTVVRLTGGHLWVHSPIPLSETLRRELEALGNVRFIIAPNKVHHLFVGDCSAAFPNAMVFGAPGLTEKRPDLVQMHELSITPVAQWHDELDQILFEGVPLANETVWFHRATRTLIVTDLVQLIQGDLHWTANLYARLTNVHQELSVSRMVRACVKDKAAARRSALRILEWPTDRIVLGHNTIIDVDAHERLRQALTKAFF